MVVLPTIEPSLQGDSRMLKHSCSEVCVMHCMTYFYCAPLQSCRGYIRWNVHIPIVVGVQFPSDI